MEASGIHELCREVIAKNGYADKITVLHGCVEDVILPDNVKADVIISEWMGFYLLHESMLNSVIIARDRFLKPDGVLVPSAANLYICPVSMTDFYNNNLRFWNSLYGFNFSPVASHVKQKMLTAPQIELLAKEQCLAEPERVLSLDLKYVDREDVRKIFSHVKFRLTKNGLLHGLAFWFDVEFDGDVPSLFSTGPNCEETHWKQTIIMLPDALLVNRSEEFECTVLAEQSAEHPRRYNLSIEVPEDVEEDEAEVGEAMNMINEAMQHCDEQTDFLWWNCNKL